MPRLASAVFLAIALFLFGIALLPQPTLHALLTRAANDAVTIDYVQRVQTRAWACAAIALTAAIGWWLVRHEAWRGDSVAPALQSPSRVALGLMAIGIGARLAILNGPPHYDEAFTLAEYASRSPLFFLSRYTHSNNHVFHTLLAWLVPGNELWALRLPAFLAGVGVLVATYFLARKWHGERVACVAVALAAVASPLVEYSAQARGYTMLTLAFLLLFLFDDPRLRALALALGAWTVPTMLYAATAWALWLIATRRAWRHVALVAFAGGSLAFVLYLPILIISGLDSIIANGTTLSVPYPVLFRELPQTFVDLARHWSYSFTAPVAVALAVVAAIATVRGNASALASTLVACAVLLLVLRKVPFARVWIFVLPLVLIAAASVIGRIRIPAVALSLITIVLAVQAVRVTARDGFVEDPAMRDAKAMAERIEQLPPNARVLVSTPLDSVYAFYVPERVVQARFDSDRAAVRTAMLAAPLRYAVISHRVGENPVRTLLPFTPVPIARMKHSTLVELR